MNNKNTAPILSTLIPNPDKSIKELFDLLYTAICNKQKIKLWFNNQEKYFVARPLLFGSLKDQYRAEKNLWIMIYTENSTDDKLLNPNNYALEWIKKAELIDEYFEQDFKYMDAQYEFKSYFAPPLGV